MLARQRKIDSYQVMDMKDISQLMIERSRRIGVIGLCYLALGGMVATLLCQILLDRLPALNRRQYGGRKPLKACQRTRLIF